jgi:chaperonin GroEL
MRNTVFQDKARQGLKGGVDLIADAVKATLGPRGRNVIYGFPYSYPKATKDGVTVARQVETSDQLKQLGVLLIREVAQKTADDSGDGTTTASVLAQAIVTEGLKSLNTGANPILIKRGIDKAVDEIVAFIEQNSQQIEGEEAILNVATVSANNDRAIGELITEAISRVGPDGVVTIEDNYGGATSEVLTIEGMQLNEGMLSPLFMTDLERQVAEYSRPRILIIDSEVYDVAPITPIIEETISNHKCPLIIMAHNITGPALHAIAMGKAKQGAPLLAVKAPQFGTYREDMIGDIATLTGATIVGGNLGIKARDITYEQLGECERLVADRYSTTIVGGKGDKTKVAARIAQIDQAIEACSSDYDREKLQERLAKLTSGVAVVKVGGNSELEQQEKKMRVEDSLHATKAAIEEGIVPGGGIMYLRASQNGLKTASDAPTVNEEEKIGYSIVKKALRAPILQIARNSGIAGDEVIAQLLLYWVDVERREPGSGKGKHYGYNFLTNRYEDLVMTGVIDPTKVVKNALRNAASVAGTMLTTEVVIHDEEEIEPALKTPKPRSE